MIYCVHSRARSFDFISTRYNLYEVIFLMISLLMMCFFCFKSSQAGMSTYAAPYPYQFHQQLISSDAGSCSKRAQSSSRALQSRPSSLIGVLCNAIVTCSHPINQISSKTDTPSSHTYLDPNPSPSPDLPLFAEQLKVWNYHNPSPEPTKTYTMSRRYYLSPISLAFINET